MSHLPPNRRATSKLWRLWSPTQRAYVTISRGPAATDVRLNFSGKEVWEVKTMQEAVKTLRDPSVVVAPPLNSLVLVRVERRCKTLGVCVAAELL